ncbi:MAG TPA: methyltransferase domain-containing protein [Fibrobacteria bacterium]|nr:methyltransferase domain-containing protein [Fibrobacteria bacterium]
MLKIAKSAAKSLLLKSGLSRLTEYGIMANYIGKNLNNRRKAVLKSPYVCEFPAFSPERCVEYVDEVVGDYFKRSGVAIDSVRGKRILEIGPGENLGVGLQLLMLGAKEVMSVDRFRSLRPIADQTSIYRKLRERLDPAGKAEFDALIRLDGDAYTLNPERYRYIPDTPLETLSLSGAREDAFDLILSRAVLEHLYDLDKAMDVMHRLLKPGGRMIHEVDFRDHGMYTNLGLNPLSYLTVPDRIWGMMSSHLGAPNRCLSDFFSAKMEKLGYRHHTIVKSILDGSRTVYKAALVRGVDFDENDVRQVEAIRPRLLPRYRDLPLETLLVSIIILAAEKPA